MSIWKHIILTYYFVSVTAFILLVACDGLGVINLKDGTVTTLTAIYATSILALAGTTIRTKDFWKDDPDSIWKLKKEIVKLKGESLAAQVKNNAVISELRKTNAESEEELALRRSGKRPAPQPIRGSRKPRGNI
jgi:hypothetical protein